MRYYKRPLDKEELMEEHYSALEAGVPCPKCELGKGLRASSAFEIGLTGWEKYVFLHCDLCGANFVGRGGEWHYMRYQVGG